jgi:RimJ/RimL family protein N-acetyltransferase
MKMPLFRQWKDSDLEPFARMNADPDVMRYFLSPMTREEAHAAVVRMRATIERRGWGIWAVEVDGEFAGMLGLNEPRWQLPFSPCTEVLWRLRKEFWGRGIAFTAAGQALEYGFSKLGLQEIVAFTTPPNLRSIHLMERLGFTRDLAGDFDHPAVPEGHYLRRHVLYRKRNPNQKVAKTEVKQSEVAVLNVYSTETSK